jgi:hypothetical protein
VHALWGGSLTLKRLELKRSGSGELFWRWLALLWCVALSCSALRSIYTPVCLSYLLLLSRLVSIDTFIFTCLRGAFRIRG